MLGSAKWLLTYAQKIIDFVEIFPFPARKSALGEANKIVKKMISGTVDKIIIGV